MRPLLLWTGAATQRSPSESFTVIESVPLLADRLQLGEQFLTLGRRPWRALGEAVAV